MITANTANTLANLAVLVLSEPTTAIEYVLINSSTAYGSFDYFFYANNYSEAPTSEIAVKV